MQRRSVLLVEDNPGDAELVREHLAMGSTRIRYTVTWVSTLEAALTAARERPFDLALVDLGLPDAEGLESVARVRAADATLPVVVLTGLHDESMGISALKAGAQDYLEKDLASGPLLARVLEHAMERRRQEVFERQVQASLLTILESMPIGIVAARADGSLFFVNDEAAAALGPLAPTEASTAAPLFDALRGDARGGEALAPALAGVKPAKAEVEVQTEMGLRTLAISAVPVDDGRESSPLVVVAVVDVTEMRRTEEQTRASQRLEAIGRLAGGVAHDFNNLLSVIMNFGEFALTEASGKQAQEDLGEVLKAARRGADLTRQLLTFARRRPVEPAGTELDARVRDCEPLLRRAVGDAVALGLKLHGRGALVGLEGVALDQLLMNLTLNARDAMPEGGSVVVETGRVLVGPEGRVLSPDRVPEGEYALLSVRDSGEGMARDVKERVFEPFFTTKPAGQGTGLGLATCYGIVKRAGGYIGLESAPGVGTAFHLYLPCLSGTALVSSPEEDDDGASARGDGETILIVDDDAALRLAAGRGLSEHGYAVLSASSGAEALLLCERHDGPIDLLVTDVVMPYMSGVELVEKLHAMRPGLLALYMSGHHEEILDHDAVVLPKPFTPTQLALCVKGMLDRAEERPHLGEG